MMECTYGDKSHADPELAYFELRDVVRRTLERKGKVIIPSFAVGRTQDLVYNLNRLLADGEIPKVPVFVDSPLAVSASDVYQQHTECFDAETAAFVAQGKHREALGFGTLTYTRSADESKALNERKDPMIIISAAGMAENGRIRHHLKYNIENPKNTILIVSWQAPDTLGRRIADREKRVHILGDVYDVRAEVATIGGLSAHAGQNLLTEYALACRERLKHVWLVHGEEKGARPLMARLAQEGLRNVSFPVWHESAEIE
jgi:metallo-beta-lactamase family protein